MGPERFLVLFFFHIPVYDINIDACKMKREGYTNELYRI